ncbi:MAG TPA: enoyl-CoA hydratase-related protein, partial [Myxococcaceae bacterium]|nr:enoyl-CoA hydratase-related protein [Myxococcaceae bacterium]
MATPAKQLESKALFSYAVQDGVATIVFDTPGEAVNTIAPEVGPEFEQMLSRAEKDAVVRAVVFTSGKKDTFIAGAKLDFLQEIKTAQEAAQLSRKAQEGFNRLDSFPKPVVAAIHGACLGGGLEWAMACDYRIVSDSAKTTLGQPETQLGLLPGAGGTQRLPKLIGAQAALDLILTGKNVRPNKARKLGLVDEVVPQPILLEIARRRASELALGKLQPERDRARGKSSSSGWSIKDLVRGIANKETWAELALEDNPVGRKFLFDQARKQVLKKTKGKYPAPERALECIREGLEHGLEKGLAKEAELFGELVISDVCKRLVEIFFATNELKKDNGVADPKVKARPVKKVAVLGGGLMGGGIAYVTL